MVALPRSKLQGRQEERERPWGLAGLAGRPSASSDLLLGAVGAVLGAQQVPCRVVRSARRVHLKQ